MGKFPNGSRGPQQNRQPNREQSSRSTQPNSNSNNSDVAFEESLKLFNETVDKEVTKLMQNGWKAISTELSKMIRNIESAKALDKCFGSQTVNSSTRQEGTSSQHATSESSTQIEVDELIGSLRTVAHKFNDYLTEMSLRSDISATIRKSYLTKIADDLKAIDLPDLSSSHMDTVNARKIVVKTEPNSSDDTSRDQPDQQSKRARYSRNSKKQ
ncbi:hypothetical protein GCK72_019648 [Caenorhabditis remanei]|uniref:Uncharacterized protein n=1 Tax=Caenorhabditis remanei TaxID=31234 RepID=A0A6A5GF21_CAERE|nr:hypothetical protein GCK72_019648 [Caenorhabditis remanei]KAF1753092.1 hypothetical protein GCK72_019648 [Caenorhabditis remanei]